MAQITQVHVTHNVLSGTLQYVTTLFMLVCLVTTLLGIKVWWFKRRLNFDATQNDLARDNYRAETREPVTTRAASSVPRKVNHRRSQQQFDEPVTVHGVFRKRDEHECENEIMSKFQLPPVTQSLNAGKKPSFFRTFTTKSSQKVSEFQTRSATISTSTVNPFRKKGIKTNNAQFTELIVNQQRDNDFSFKRAKRPETSTSTMTTEISTTTTTTTAASTSTTPTFATAATTTTPTIEMLTAPENEPDVLLHASIIPMVWDQPKTNEHEQQEQEHVLEKSFAEQLSLSSSMSSLSSLERFYSLPNNFGVVQDHQNHYRPQNDEYDGFHNDKKVDVEINEITNPNIFFEKMSKKVVEKQYENNVDKNKINNNEMDVIENMVNNNNNNNDNNNESIDVNLEEESKEDFVPEKPPRRQSKKAEKTISELFEHAVATAFEDEAARFSLDFGSGSDNFEMTKSHDWKEFSWDNPNNKNYDEFPDRFVSNEDDEKFKEQQLFGLEQHELPEISNQNNLIKAQQQQQYDNDDNKEGVINDNSFNAFGKSIDEDWENFEKLAQIPKTITNASSTPITAMDQVTEVVNDSEDNKVITKVTEANKNRKMSRNNLRVTFDLEDHYLPAASNSYDSDSSSNDSNHDWHTLRQKYVDASTKDTTKILAYEDDIIKMPPPLPFTAPPVLTLIYYDEDEDHDNYLKNITDNDYSANDSIMPVNIKPLENITTAANGVMTPPQARPRTTVQIHHAMNSSFRERTTEA